MPNKQPIKKWEKHLKRHFSKKDIQMAKKHEKMLNITHYFRNANQNDNEISPTPSSEWPSVRMAIIKKSTNNKCWKGCGEKEHSYTVGGNAN